MKKEVQENQETNNNEITEKETIETYETIGVPSHSTQNNIHWGDTSFGSSVGFGIALMGFALIIYALGRACS